MIAAMEAIVVVVVLMVVVALAFRQVATLMRS